MTTVLTGANDFARLAALDKLLANFSDAHGEFGIERIEAGELDAGRLAEMVSSQPFLSTRRMLIVRDLSINKNLSERIEYILDSVSESTDLVLVESKLDKRTALYKTLKKRTEFNEFNALDEQGLVNWTVMYVNDKEGKIKPNDARYLISRFGVNQIGLKHELDKLLSYEQNIDKDAIDLLTEPMPSSSMFDLLDAAFAGNRQKAMSLYQDQRKQQVEPQAIMGMIAWQLHNLAVVKLNEKQGADEIARLAKLNPYVVRKTMNLTRSLTPQQVKDLVDRALRLDVRLKSEQIDADDAVQHFLLTI